MNSQPDLVDSGALRTQIYQQKVRDGSTVPDQNRYGKNSPMPALICCKFLTYIAIICNIERDRPLAS
jgi:hypothetical protein